MWAGVQPRKPMSPNVFGMWTERSKIIFLPCDSARVSIICFGDTRDKTKAHVVNSKKKTNECHKIHIHFFLSNLCILVLGVK